MINIYLIVNFLNLQLVFLIDVLMQIPMADTFRAEGKIYVVLVVILIILAGFFMYLWRLDRKLKKLEEELKNKL